MLLLLPLGSPNTTKPDNELVITFSSTSNKIAIKNAPTTLQGKPKSPVISADQAAKEELAHLKKIVTNPFYEIQELDKPIKPLSEIHIEYPSTESAVTGEMTLDLYIDDTGKVESVSVNGSTLPKPFQDIAVNSFLYKNFEKGLRKGIAVKVHLRIKLEVKPEDLLRDLQ